MKDNAIEDKSYRFAVRIVNLCKYVQKMHNEYVMTRQLMRAGTSIGANVAEAQRAQSRADFIAKLSISHKEAYESRYWIRLMHETGYLDDGQAGSILRDCLEIEKLLTAILLRLKQ